MQPNLKSGGVSALSAVALVIVCSTPGPAAAQSSAPMAAPSSAPANTRTEANQPSAGPTYLLGPDDQIIIHAVDAPDIAEKPQRVDATGYLRMPMIGRIHAAGLTVEELETEVIRRLREFVREPDVAVTVTEFKSKSVSVLGAVNTPGVQLLETGKTLIEVLSKAGGTSPDAGPVLRITRRLEEGRIPLADATDNRDTGFSIAEIALQPLLDARTPEKNIPVRAGDVLSVPRAELVYVVGEVNKAGPLPLTRGNSISVVEAISAAGGMLRTASASNVRILRITAGVPERADIAIDLKKIMQGRADDRALVPGDILVVPDSGGKRATMRALEAALQFGVVVGSYGVTR